MISVYFGRTGLKVSAYALGTGMLGAHQDRTIDADAAHAVLRAFVEAGGNLIDTSDAYQGGRSEDLIGSLLPQLRDDLVLASKYGRTPNPAAARSRVGSHRKAMVQAVEGSLQRLRTDRIDVYFAHYDDGVTPVDEIMRGFDDLVASGKILYAGLSNFSAWRTAQAATTAELRGWTPLAAIEVEYSLLQRSTEREILPLAQDLGLAVLAYSPLAAGVLARDDASGSGSRMGMPSEGDTAAVVQTVRQIAVETGYAAPHVALAWLTAKGAIPVLGARHASQLQSTLGAAEVSLSAEQIDRLDAASAIPLGYPAALQAAFRRAQQPGPTGTAAEAKR